MQHLNGIIGAFVGACVCLVLASCGDAPASTDVSVPPTATAVAPTATPAPTDTPIPPTATAVPTNTPPPPTATVPVRAVPVVPVFACAGGCITPPDASCNIKGNVNSKGEKIYHAPGMRDYKKTEIDPGNGERWFCTETEAVEAGWRRAKQ